jgi:DNA polymerase I-like protein with 3'-5' exonuclease and polymerase domains
MSCVNPNGQNVSKQDEYNLRAAFGPAPGREWWTLDAQNIERRIPAYEAGEEEIITIFDRPSEPPYYGSEHLLTAHILHPKLFEDCRDERGQLDGRLFKKRYQATLYQWLKNGNFAIQYGAQKAKADATYHVAGAYDKLKRRFRRQEELNQHWIAFAKKNGYVETLPDKTVDPRHGYPILCTRTEWGDISPTIPLNYHTSGTAMQWMRLAMPRCQDQLDEWNESLGRDEYFMILQVHDELAFDFPKGRGPEPWKTNLPKVRKLQAIMESGGEGIGIPTPVGIEYHAVSWAEGAVL